MIIEVISTNKSEISEVNGYGAISPNDEVANNFYIVHFIFFPYTIQEDVESDGNKLSSGDLVCNVIYKYPGRHKSCLYVNSCKKQKYVTL